jgi:hypothetical protein
VDRLIASKEPTGDAWTELISAGESGRSMRWRDHWPIRMEREAVERAFMRIERDSESGQTYLKLPVPSPQIIGRAVLWLQTLAGAMGAK